jgi:hypothetical protein
MDNNNGKNLNLINDADYWAVIDEVSKVSPLDDKAFKKFLENEDNFRTVAEMFINEPLSDGVMHRIKEELFLMVNGKTIRMDNVRKTDAEIVNIDGQQNRFFFPFKRQLFYWAITYISTLQEGEKYNLLLPAISIVIYENRGQNIDLIETAQLEGTLLHSKDDKNQLQLIAVNTVKWREAENEKLKQYLSILHNGVLSEKTKDKFEGVDIASPFFIKLNREILMASAEIKYEEIGKGGGIMAKRIYKFLTEEQEKAAMEKGMERGMERGMEEGIKKGMEEAIKTIAKETGLSLEKLQEMVSREAFYG